MSEQTYHEPRYRINASQTAKGAWYFDATVEYSKDIFRKADSADIAITQEMAIGEKLLEIIQKTEAAFKKDGRKLVGDISE